MGTWPLWIAFNAGVVLLLLFDLGLFHRRSHTISIREASIESAAWVALSAAFGFWILVSHGRGPGLEFFTGYLIEKSLSVDNVLIFLLIFQYFRVDSRYQHRLLFWGVLGAIAMRGLMIGVGVILIERFAWILYLFGAFLVYAGFRLFRADHAIRPEENPILRWARNLLPVARRDHDNKLFVRELGRWLVTPLFLVLIVLETTDLAMATDSIPAVFGVTHDPFLVYTSNVCAILGLRSLYFLFAGILPYIRFLNKGLAIVLIFIGTKMLVEPFVHISTGLSLIVVGSMISAAVLFSCIPMPHDDAKTAPFTPEDINRLADPDPDRRAVAAWDLFKRGTGQSFDFFDLWKKDEDFCVLLVQQQFVEPDGKSVFLPRLTVGIAVHPENFEKVRAANGFPPLSDVPPDQDALEFELEFTGKFTGKGARSSVPPHRLDILTTNAPGRGGAIARFLGKFGEAIQQVEIDVTDVDRATEVLRRNFHLQPIYPLTRPGANGTRLNFFLVTNAKGEKVLIELVEQPKTVSTSRT